MSVSLPVLLPAAYCQSTHILLAFTIAKLQKVTSYNQHTLWCPSVPAVRVPLAIELFQEIVGTVVLIHDTPTASGESKWPMGFHTCAF